MIVLKRVKLMGFRGSRKPLEMSFSKSIVLAGPSGSGKTTVLQAIEWGLFGDILGFKGYGFTDEDAYVNMFSDESKATVELDFLLPNETSLFIKRNRKKAKKSTVRRTTLNIWINGESHTGKEAQDLIEELLDLDHEKFTQAIFLHQEMIRKFVEGRPKDRSEIIDQLLGLRNLREFAETLDPKRKIRNEIKILQEVKEGLEKQKTTIEIETQERLNQQKEELTKKGHKETELSIKYVNNQIDSLINQLNVLSKEYNLDLKQEKIKVTNTELAQDTLKQIESLILDVDRARSGQISKYETSKIRIQELLKQLGQASIKIKNKSIEKLAKQTSEIDNELRTQMEQKEELVKRIDDIAPILSEFNHLSSLYTEKKKELRKIAVDSGEYAILNEQKSDNLRRIDRLKDEVRKEDSLTQILSSAYSYISKTAPKDCPICRREIDPKTILTELEAQNKTTGERLSSNRKTIDDLEEKNQELDSLLHKWGLIQKESDLLKANITDKIQQLRKITSIDDMSPQKAATLLEESRKKIRGIEGEIQKNELKKREFEQEKEDVEETNKSIRKLKENLKDLIPNLSSEDPGLLDHSARFHLDELATRIEELQKTEPIDSLHEKVERIEPVVEYLSKLEEFERKIGEKSKIDERIDNINYKMVKLDDLETSLQIIREVVSEHQNELTNKSLEEFQSSIDYYYNKTIGHPVFKKMRIKPLPEEPVTYDLLAYDEKEELETHVNTRFSTAQANVTALALFFAMNQKLAANFPLIILDDPTQNMDQTYQMALAKVLGSIADNRQLIVATHEIQFAKEIIGETSSEIDLIHLNKWTIEGPNPEKT